MINRKRKRQEYVYFNTLPFPYTIPPLNNLELTWLVSDFLLKDILRPPFDSQFLLRYIKKGFRGLDFSSYVLSKLKINEVIRDYIKHQIITYEEMLICSRRCYYIKSIDLEKLKIFTSQINDYKITNDFDIFLEKAKLIATDCMKEINYTYDEDDIIANSNKNTNGDSEGYFYNDSVNKYSSMSMSKNSNKKNNIESNSYSYNYENLNNYTSYFNQQVNEDNIQEDNNFLNNLLYAPSAKNIINSNDNEALEIQEFLSVREKMQSKYESQNLRPFCKFATFTDCNKKHFSNAINRRDNIQNPCKNVHFRPIINNHTDITLGDCSYLDTCRHMDICKFVHYQIDDEGVIPSNRKELVLSGDENALDAQWANCDIRYFDYKVLGKFDVIMADPPWDIHMDLPYGTLSDEEMKNLKIKDLQDDGVIFLWVTGRASELARECLELWGYERKEELVWIKTNQLQRLIRTGRTGHWLNHSKEHCLVGYKGNPKINRNIDCDVLVSEVRETSRKPDEIYEVIERMNPGGRKLELFARAHNRRKGWISLGNQLPGVYFVENDLVQRFNEVYPESKLTEEVMRRNKESSIIKKLAQ
jgi:mRNA (2'-O-methyladenosine-N6-)-methyltransferase